ncbi:MAG: hypothetical protein ACI8XO_002763 [Verrucomicrobiales bacterium]|jgi:uncharacterized protein (DUF2132 family)
MDETNQENNKPEPPANPKPGAANDPLHGVSLKLMLERLVDYLGWDEMSDRIGIRCFSIDPSINSSLKFLRRTPWARNKVEQLYLRYDFSEDKK